MKPSTQKERSSALSCSRLVRRFARALCKIEEVAEAEDYYISPAAGKMVTIASKALRPGKHLARKTSSPNKPDEERPAWRNS